MPPVSIRFLDGDSDAGTLRQLYDTVIAASFPPAEREPFEKLRRVLAADELRGAVAVTPDGEPVGALFLEWFADIRAALLCYFAVRPDRRGQGIGRRLVAVAGPRWRAELEPHVVLAEAGDPRFSDADYGDGGARLRLYEGFGARRLPIPYLMPELMPGAGRLPGLLLLVIEAAEAVSPAPDRIRGAIVGDFLVRYFARMEGGAVREGDSALRPLLAECRETDHLPLVALTRG
ncbi:GNAT family N-acetyltransferase [Actinoplanes sp. NPDC024001]|uniref:GNAT family N-acetyltransferase n=1 Tax=Actinoplanes sp. NPDC024001 TaxID=3154598 RepID=UPI0034048CE0